MLGNITHFSKDGVVYLKISGELDSRLVTNFQNIFEEFLEAGESKFILALSECTFVYSVGIGKIVYFMKKIEEIPDSFLRITGAEPRIRQLFELVHLGHILD